MTKPKFEIVTNEHVPQDKAFVVRTPVTPESLKKAIYIPLQKAQPVQDSDGVLTSFGMQIAERYATAWVKRGDRDLELERLYPELEGFFWDIRSDAKLAREHAAEG